MKNAGTKGLERRMTTVRETDVTVGGGRVLHAYDGRQTGRNYLTLALVARFW